MSDTQHKDAPAFDFYPERWTHGTRQMTKVERCDYIDLLCHQWTDDGLPLDLDRVALLIGYKKGSQIPAVVLDKFPEWADGKRRNTKLEFERQKQRQRILESGFRQSVNAWKRWHKGKPLPDYLLTIEAYQAHCHGNAMASPPALPRLSPPPTTHPFILSQRGEGWPELSEVEQEAERVLAPRECAVKFTNDMDGCGWVNKHGQPLVDWRPVFWNYATAWKANEHQRKTSNGYRQQPQERPTMQL